MEKKYEVILRDELKKMWDEERAEKFMKDATENSGVDQIEALSKMIGYVEEEVESLDEKTLGELMERMDTFDGPLEFLEYFFKMTQEDVADSVVAAMKEDPEEIEAMLESMEDSGLIEYLVELDSFYVWYKG